MFQQIGHLAARRAGGIVGFWVLLLAASALLAPRWSEVVQNGEFAFLPEDAASVIAEREFREAFPDDILESSIVVVIRRQRGEEGLLDYDLDFASNTVIPGLHEIVGTPLPEDLRLAEDPEQLRQGSANDFTPLVQDIKTFENPRFHDLLMSENKKATLILIELSTEFLDQANEPLVDRIEAFLGEVPRRGEETDPTWMRPGLDLAVSGTATFGRDMIRESLESARSTERWTVVLVVVLLLAIYRAPLLALIPLVTVAVSTIISLNLLSIAAGWGWLQLFNGIETYVTVIVYGAGVDYCLFLIARYREEFDEGATIEDAVSDTLTRIGAALTASAGTVMCGIGMMVFAEFGKFQQAGIAITFGLAVCLAAALTLTPAILRLFRQWAFWPNVRQERPTAADAWPVRPDSVSRMLNAGFLQRGWEYIGQLLLRRTWTMWLASVLGMLPFAVLGVSLFTWLSYGLLSELPPTATSVNGARAVQANFAAGEAGPVSVMITSPDVDFTDRGRDPTGEDLIETLTEALLADREALGLHDVRSLSSPRGRRELTRLNPLERGVALKRAREYYISQVNPHVTRIDLIFTNDPFSRSSITEYRRLRDELRDYLPEDLKSSRLTFKGPTANISDLKEVTDRDQIRIDVLVLVGVFAILWILLRRPGICAYLLISVFYSYLATLGVTFAYFYSIDPDGFAGLDWKVPLFLFTILIAVGEDYNIFLISRIDEEDRRHGPIQGIIVALQKTGSIISSCGIIMAGTFSSLLAGSLVGMDQLGFALAIGVLMDTFVVRPVMVPAFLLLLRQGELGIFSRLAGYSPDLTDSEPDA